MVLLYKTHSMCPQVCHLYSWGTVYLYSVLQIKWKSLYTCLTHYYYGHVLERLFTQQTRSLKHPCILVLIKYLVSPRQSTNRLSDLQWPVTPFFTNVWLKVGSIVKMVLRNKIVPTSSLHYSRVYMSTRCLIQLFIQTIFMNLSFPFLMNLYYSW